MSSGRLELVLEPSRWLCRWLHLVLWLGWWPPLWMSLQNPWLAICLVPWWLIWKIQSQAWCQRSAPNCLRRVLLTQDGMEWQLADGRLLELAWCGEALVLSRWVIVSGMTDQRQRHWLVVTPDRTDAQSFRRLKVMLRTQNFSGPDSPVA